MASVLLTKCMYDVKGQVVSFLIYVPFIYNMYINKIQLWNKQYSKVKRKIYTRI